MQGLLSVSFGTSYVQTREKTIDKVDARLAAAFPERAFYAAWTSGFIVRKVRADRGEHHDTLEEAFDRLSADGVDDLVVATMCLMQGHEMRKIVDAARAWASAGEGRTVRVAAPVLAGDEDRRRVCEAVADEFAHVAPDEALLLMGHGLERALIESAGAGHDPNAVYVQVQNEFDALGHANFLVATVEGTPVFADALAALQERGARRVHVAPFMIVAGDHARNDLAGDDDDSWKSQLEAAGFAVVPALKGLGEYDAIQQLVCDHARDAQPLEKEEA